MEGFDTMAMPYLASPLSLGNLQSVDYLNTMHGMELPEQQPNFESEAFVRCVFIHLSLWLQNRTKPEYCIC